MNRTGCASTWMALALATLSPPACATGDGLVGLAVPPYPDGLQELQGTCLSGSEDYARICDHGIAVLGRHEDPERDAILLYVVAQRSLGRDGGQARWEITDALPYPDAGKDDWLQVATCRIDGVDDGNVAALVHHDTETEYSDDVTWARRLDFESGRLLEIDPARVDCINEGLGV